MILTIKASAYSRLRNVDQDINFLSIYLQSRLLLYENNITSLWYRLSRQVVYHPFTFFYFLLLSQRKFSYKISIISYRINRVPQI